MSVLASKDTGARPLFHLSLAEPSRADELSPCLRPHQTTLRAKTLEQYRILNEHQRGIARLRGLEGLADEARRAFSRPAQSSSGSQPFRTPEYVPSQVSGTQRVSR